MGDRDGLIDGLEEGEVLGLEEGCNEDHFDGMWVIVRLG